MQNTPDSEATEEKRVQLLQHARWNTFRLGVPFFGATVGMSMLYSILATTDPLWALGPLCFVASALIMGYGYHREFRGLSAPDPVSGQGAKFVLLAVGFFLLGIFGPVFVLP